MRKLASTFEQLEEEVVEATSYSEDEFDDIELEDALEHALVTLEQASEQMDRIQEQLEFYEGQDEDTVVSLDELPEDLQPLFTQTALEAYGFPALGLEEKVGGITDYLGRLWQVFFLDFLRTFDWVVDLIKSSKKRMEKYRARIDEIRRKFQRKRPDLNQENQKASYVKLENYWFTEDGFVKQPFAQLRKEEDLVKFTLNKFVDLIEKDMDDLSSVAKRARFDDTEAFDKTVIKPLERKGHPVYHFDKSFLGGRPYMLNTGIAISGKREGSDNLLQSLARNRKVKVSTRLMGHTSAGMVPRIIPDVQMSNKEIDELLNWGDKFLDHSEHFFKGADNMQRHISTLRASLEAMMKSAKKSDNKKLVRDIKDLGGYAKMLVDAYWGPTMKVAKRNIDLSKGIAYLAGRLVARAK